MAYTGFTPKQKQEHYTGVANGTIPPKANSSVSAQSQIDYARGQRDARNEMNRNYLLGKNSHLTEEEKTKMKADIRQKNKKFRADLKVKRQIATLEAQGFKVTKPKKK